MLHNRLVMSRINKDYYLLLATMISSLQFYSMGSNQNFFVYYYYFHEYAEQYMFEKQKMNTDIIGKVLSGSMVGLFFAFN